jgi:hypothetical protein
MFIAEEVNSSSEAVSESSTMGDIESTSKTSDRTGRDLREEEATKSTAPVQGANNDYGEEPVISNA